MVVNALVRLSTYVHAPDDIDGKAALDQLRLSFAGTIYVDGGWQNLVNGLVNAALAAGATIKTSERISRVSRQADGTIRLEARGGRTEDFAAAIVAVPPRSAIKLVACSSQLAAAVAASRPVRVVSLDLALANLPAAGADFALGFDEPSYLSVHSAVSALAPDGGAVMHVARYLAPDERPSPEHFADIEQVADALQPGWRSAIMHEQRLSGATVAFDFPQWELQGRRAVGALADTPGVFLAGDWVGESGMLADAAASSGRVAASAAMKHLQEFRDGHQSGRVHHQGCQ